MHTTTEELLEVAISVLSMPGLRKKNQLPPSVSPSQEKESLQAVSAELQ
jgi:hypothetical protein